MIRLDGVLLLLLSLFIDDLVHAQEATDAYITCMSSYEDAWGTRQEYFCFDTQQCCSSVKEWYGCCDKSSTTAVLDKPVSIKLVLIIAGVISSLLFTLLICCVLCKVMKRRHPSERSPVRTGVWNEGPLRADKSAWGSDPQNGTDSEVEARRSLEVGALSEFDKAPTAPPLDHELPPPYEQIAGEQSMPLQSTTRW